MDTDQMVYRSYLLRLWRQGSDPSASWYASLEDPVTGTRRGFSSIEEMLAYFRQQFVEDLTAAPESQDDTLNR